MVDLIFFAYGGNVEKKASEIREYIQSICKGKDIAFYCDQTTDAIEAHGYIGIDKAICSLECLNQAPSQFEVIDRYKSIFKTSCNVIIVVITNDTFINNYFGLQYAKNPGIKPGEAIACNDYSLPYWAEEITHIGTLY